MLSYFGNFYFVQSSRCLGTAWKIYFVSFIVFSRMTQLQMFLPWVLFFCRQFKRMLWFFFIEFFCFSRQVVIYCLELFFSLLLSHSPCTCFNVTSLLFVSLNCTCSFFLTWSTNVGSRSKTFFLVCLKNFLSELHLFVTVLQIGSTVSCACSGTERAHSHNLRHQQ